MWHRKQSAILLIVLTMGLSLAVGCTGQTGNETAAPTNEAEPAEVVNPIVSATGEVIPAKWATLSFPIAGRIADLRVKEGDVVKAGDIIARLDTTDLDAQVAQAEAALAVAEANLELTKAGPRQEEIERARSSVTAANARVAAAQAELEQARKGATEAEIIEAQTAVAQARQAQEDLQESYNSIIWWVDHWPDDLEPGDRTPLDGEQALRYSLEIANLNLAAAEKYLNDLLAGPDPDRLRAAEAQVWAAAARRDAAQAQLDLLLAGPSSEAIAIAEAEVERARAALETARAVREQAILTAPFDGTVSELNIAINEWVNPGQPILLLADLNTLWIETTDLNEIDVARVEIGDSVNITFDALPGIEVIGRVSRIAPKAAEGTGVNFRVTIEMDETPAELRWGMTAFVDIQTGQ